MVWNRSIRERMDLRITQNGALVALRCAKEILRPQVVYCTAAIVDFFLLMPDDSRLYIAQLLENMLETKTIQHMEWPLSSPDIIRLSMSGPQSKCTLHRDPCYR